MSLGDAERHDTPNCEYARVCEGVLAPRARPSTTASSVLRKRPPRLPTFGKRSGGHLFLSRKFFGQSPRQIPRSRAVWTVSESSGTVFMTLTASSMRTGTMCGGW